MNARPWPEHSKNLEDYEYREQTNFLDLKKDSQPWLKSISLKLGAITI